MVIKQRRQTTYTGENTKKVRPRRQTNEEIVQVLAPRAVSSSSLDQINVQQQKKRPPQSNKTFSQARYKLRSQSVSSKAKPEVQKNITGSAKRRHTTSNAPKPVRAQTKAASAQAKNTSYVKASQPKPKAKDTSYIKAPQPKAKPPKNKSRAAAKPRIPVSFATAMKAFAKGLATKEAPHQPAITTEFYELVEFPKATIFSTNGKGINFCTLATGVVIVELKPGASRYPSNSNETSLVSNNLFIFSLLAFS